MSKINLLVHISGYDDVSPTNSSTKNVSRWTHDEQALDASEIYSKLLKLQAGQTLELFSGVIAISDDNTTTYDISLKPNTSSTYIIKNNSGTAPDFRSANFPGADATTEITVTKNGPILTFTSTAGTALDLISNGMLVGDDVRLGEGFNTANQGRFTVLAFNATSFQVKNLAGAEEVVVLGADFATDLQNFGSAGVQIGDKVKITSGFSSVTFNTYEITDVNPEYLEVYSINSLPEETNIQTRLYIYNNSKNFLYIESDKKLELVLNGTAAIEITPMRAGIKAKKGVFLKSGETFSASITNKSTDVASVFYTSAE